MSLFHIDAGKEWRGGQRQSLFLVRELRKLGYRVEFVVQPGSPLEKKAVETGVPVLPVRMRCELDLLAAFRLARQMKKRGCRLVHFHEAHGLAVGASAARRAGVPLRFISRRVDFPLKSRAKYTWDVDAIIDCGYAANRQIARFRRPILEIEDGRPLEKVATPNSKTIQDLADYLSVPKSKTGKAVFLMASIPQAHEVQDRLVFAIVRGDMEVNETKLANALKAMELRPAREEEIQAIGAVPGYASPIGLKGAIVVIDDIIPHSTNLVAGANQEGYHYLNVNYGRDFQAEIVTDIASAEEASPCPDCGQSMKMARGVEVGNIFKLGTRYSNRP